MDKDTLKTALVIAATIALVLYVNKNYLHIEQKFLM